MLLEFEVLDRSFGGEVDKTHGAEEKESHGPEPFSTRTRFVKFLVPENSRAKTMDGQ
jgi:DMSO/TMAO reductase YedYZ molybdopterin-dependent catalytic subunit